MPVSQPITNLFNGVSQQPPALRAASQAELQENADSSLVRGLRKRNPTQYVNKIGVTSGSPHVHFIDRSPTEKWFLILDINKVVRVVNAITGAEATVTLAYPDGTPIPTPASVTYFASAQPWSDFRCLTIGDFTFVLNRSVTVNSFSAQESGVVPMPATITEVQQFSSLPGTPVAGQYYKVVGTAADRFASYYVKKSATGNAYVETRNPNDIPTIYNATLPWAFVRTGPNAFQMRVVAYAEPQVGDRLPNPPPSFVGTTLRDVFFYRNRLGFVTSSSIVLSRAGEYYNFYPKSMTSVADDDPIDLRVAHPKTPTLLHAMTFNESLLLFGNTVQFRLESGDVLSPRSAKISVLTEYESSAEARPVGQGSNLYFAQPTLGSSRVRELYVVSNKPSTTEAFDVTQHVPALLPGTVSNLAVSSQENAIFAFSRSDPLALYVYKTLFGDGGQERIQSSWSRWTFPSGGVTRALIGMGVSEARMYLMFLGDDGTYIEHLSLTTHPVPIADPTGNQWGVMLDRLISQPTSGGVYVGSVDKTYWTLPYQVDASAQVEIVVTGSPNPEEIGARLQATWITPTLVAADGVWTVRSVGIGLPYTQRYRLSPIFYRDSSGNPLVNGRLQIHNLRVLFRDTAQFAVEVTPKKRPTVRREWFSGAQSNSSIAALDVVTGSKKFAINSDAETVQIDLVNDSPFPSSFHALEWEGTYASLVQRPPLR